jgi:hypothetical protein
VPAAAEVRPFVGLAVIFQHDVPFLDVCLYPRRRCGAKVKIGCNDFQGADLRRRLLHGLGCSTVLNVRSRWEQRLDHLQLAQEMIAFYFAKGWDLHGSHDAQVNVQMRAANLGHPAWSQAAAKASYDANPGFR